MHPAILSELSEHPRPASITQRVHQPAGLRWLPALSCLLVSGLLCGCASGLMTMPGAAMLANGFSGDAKKDKDADGREKDSKKSKRSKAKEKEEDNEFGNRIETPLLSEYMSVQGNTAVVLRGVGLVTGLRGTGGDPSPSAMRTQLQNEMSRRNVKNARQILASPNTAMVIVTAYLPAMVRKGQTFDVRVALPQNANAKSLKGGWLLPTRLFEEQTVEGKGTLKGHEYGVASGAILTNLGVKDNREERQAELMMGTIPGGAVSQTDRDLSIVLRTEKRSIRNSTRIADAVSQRFHRYNSGGQKISCAEAKNDAMVALKTHEQYLNNFPRYQSVIRSIALNETDVARRIRTEQLAREVLEPDKCEAAALQLEAIGEDGIPFLKDALKSDNFEVRFQAAQSLAYLGDAAGVPVLSEAARDQPAFRVYSLVALSVIDDADAVLALRELMSSDNIETRYGAFRALKELDPHDPFLSPITFENRFTVHVIDSTGEEMVHVTRRRAPEVVLFGTAQSLRMPVVLNAGDNIRIKGEEGSNEVEIIHYQIDAEPQRQKVPNQLLHVLRACGELGATYPDIVQMLIEAERQHNLSGTFGIDRLPQAGRLYLSTATSQKNTEAVDDSRRIGAARMTPELFDELDEDELRDLETPEKLMSLNFDEVAKQDAKAAKAHGRIPPKSDKSSPSGDAAGSPDASKSRSAKPAVSDRAEAAPSDEQNDDQNDEQTEDEAARMPSAAKGESAEPNEDQPGAEDTTVLNDEAVVPDEAGDKPAWGTRWWNRISKPFGGLEEPTP